MNVGLVLYGDLNTVTGGFLYDRKIREYLLDAGDTIETYSLPWPSYNRGLMQGLFSGFANYFEPSSFDILLQDELAHPSLLFMNKRLSNRKAPLIIAIVHHMRCSENRSAWKNLFYRVIERYYLQTAHGFIFNSHATHAAVKSLVGDNKPSTIAQPGGDRFGYTISEEEIRIKAFHRGSLEIVFLGNIIPRKGLHMLVEALARLKNPSWHLNIVGDLNHDPQYTARTRERIRVLGLNTKIEFAGPVDDTSVGECLRKSHLLVVPSSYEGFGIVYLEAMGFGVPAIGSIAGGATEIITHGVNGFLVGQGDSLQLASYIDSLNRDRERLFSMAVAALRRFSQHPSWADTGRKVHQFLHNLIGR